jgi:hypothetical protein
MRETKLCLDPSTSWKLVLGILLYSLFLFCTLPPTGKRRWQPRSARAYMHVGRWVLPRFYFCQIGLPNCWRPIFLVLPKLDGCQVGLPNCWSCSKKSSPNVTGSRSEWARRQGVVSRCCEVTLRTWVRVTSVASRPLNPSGLSSAALRTSAMMYPVDHRIWFQCMKIKRFKSPMSIIQFVKP